MRYVIVGNNDGPLRLIESIQGLASSYHPVFIGLQKPPVGTLKRAYDDLAKTYPYTAGFEEEGLVKLLADLKIDMVINCFCNFKFVALLKRYKCYNIHPSYLPYYRGRHPLHWALINGEPFHGITLHHMTSAFDRGTIIWQERKRLTSDLSVAQLRAQLMQLLVLSFANTIKFLYQHPLPPSNTKVAATLGKYWPRRYPKDSQLQEWNDPEKIYRKIKALRSEPHPAFVQSIDGAILTVTDVHRLKKNGHFLKYRRPFLNIFGNHSIILTVPNGRRFRLETSIPFEENKKIILQ